MKDNLSIVITIMVLVLLMVLFPLYNFFERQDDMSYNLVLKATTNFADQVMNNGYIDQLMYNNFVNELGNTGNIYDIEIEAHRKVLTQDSDASGNFIEQSYIDYNDDIFEAIDSTTSGSIMDKTLKNKIYPLNEKDEIYVKVKNSNTTLAGSLFNAIIVTSNKTRIQVNYGGIVKNNAWAKVDATYKGHIQAPGAPKVTLGTNEIEQNSEVKVQVTKLQELSFEAVSTAFASNENVNNKIEKYFWTIIKQSDNTTTSIEGNSISGGNDAFSEGNTYKIKVYAVDTLGYKSDETVFTLNITNVLEEGNLKMFNESDLEKVRNYVEGNATLSDDEKYKYDINGDGLIDQKDVNYINSYITNGYIVGDLNNDGKIDITDVSILNKYISDISSLTQDQKNRSDVNGDGKIDSLDITALQIIISNH